MNPPDTNGWHESAKYVLKELERLNDSVFRIEKDIGKIREDIAVLKVKAGIWGVIGGTIPTIGLLLFKLVSHV